MRNKTIKVIIYNDRPWSKPHILNVNECAWLNVNGKDSYKYGDIHLRNTLTSYLGSVNMLSSNPITELGLLIWLLIHYGVSNGYLVARIFAQILCRAYFPAIVAYLVFYAALHFVK